MAFSGCGMSGISSENNTHKAVPKKDKKFKNVERTGSLHSTVVCFSHPFAMESFQCSAQLPYTPPSVASNKISYHRRQYLLERSFFHTFQASKKTFDNLDTSPPPLKRGSEISRIPAKCYRFGDCKTDFTPRIQQCIRQ